MDKCITLRSIPKVSWSMRMEGPNMERCAKDLRNFTGIEYNGRFIGGWFPRVQ